VPNCAAVLAADHCLSKVLILGLYTLIRERKKKLFKKANKLACLLTKYTFKVGVSERSLTWLELRHLGGGIGPDLNVTRRSRNKTVSATTMVEEIRVM
jgi:hypothetical protein